MNSRARILSHSATISATRVLRRRRNIEVPTADGDVVEIRDGEQFAIDLLKGSPVAVNAFRGGEYLHVSDLLGKCMRKIALSEKFSVSMPSERLHESMALTFAQGVAIHEHIKQRYIDGHPTSIYGTWSCKCGDLHTANSTFAKAQKQSCRVCGGKPTKYHELELRDNDLMLVGSPDVTLYLEEYGVYYPIEIKSIAHDAWKALERPQPDHVLQDVFYWYLLRKLGYPVPSQISILYATKGFLFQTPYKEFIVYPEKVVGRLDEYIDEARMLKASRAAGPIPARSFCSSQACTTAKECHVSNICFQHP